jgi:hypothetical protein
VAPVCPPRSMLFPAPGPRPLPPIRETQLAKKTSPMRLPISNHLRNQLKKNGFQPHESQLHILDKDATPGWGA